MPKILHSVNDLQEYLTILNKKAEHHAQSVEAIALMLAGAYFGIQEHHFFLVLSQQAFPR